ncbi:MAG: hypothetical protein JO250_20580 [Armatimonadetes bacterium]|nr:hypothetical protein [Armatimonadota bacterium]
MPLVQRKQDATHPIGDSPLCTACVVGPFVPGSALDYVVTSGLALVYTQVQTAAQEIQVKSATVVRDDGSALGVLFAVESLIGAGAATTGRALVRVTSAPAAGGILRPDLTALSAPGSGDQVVIRAASGPVAGTVADSARTIPTPVDGGPDLDDGFTVRLPEDAALNMQDSGAPVLAADGSWLGMFLYEDPAAPVAYCTKAVNM